MRVWLLDAAGEVLAERRSDEGLLAVPREGFAAVLEGHLGAMGAQRRLPVIICGMAGSRQGWIEAPYVATPARLDAILAGAVAVPGTRRDIRIVPGLAQREQRTPDVMRGEETQLAGIAACTAPTSGLHARHAFEMGRASRMASSRASHLADRRAVFGAVDAVDPAPFARRQPGEGFARQSGLPALARRRLAHAGDIGSRLFRIRAATLLQDLQPDDAAAALSGLLIGAEIASARALFADAGSDIVLVASGALGDLYAAGAGARRLRGDAGRCREAVRAGLVEAARRNFGIGRRREGHA